MEHKITINEHAQDCEAASGDHVITIEDCDHVITIEDCDHKITFNDYKMESKSSFPCGETLARQVEFEAELFLRSYGDLETSPQFLAWRSGIEKKFLALDFNIKREKQIGVGLLVDTFPPEEGAVPGLFPPRHLYSSVLPLEEKAASFVVQHFSRLGYVVKHSFYTLKKSGNEHIFVLGLKERTF